MSQIVLQDSPVSPTYYPVEGFNGFVPSLSFEADVFNCQVIGKIPEVIQGRLYRVGGEAQFPTLKNDNIINGDGLFSMFHFDNGHVSFKMRYVKTERFLAEMKERRRLFGLYRNPYTDDPQAQGVNRNNTGNTYAFFHHGKLMALREDSFPHAIDPDTLDTLDVYDLNGQVDSCCLTAHPKVDPDTGEWWSFSLFADGKIGTRMSYQVIDKDGVLTKQEFFDSPYPGLSHDFAVTKEHIIFVVMPLLADEARIKAQGDFYAYDPQLPSCWGIMPRNGSVKDIKWFKLDRCFSGHIMNAYTEGRVVHVDATICPGNGFPFFKDVNGNRTDPRESIPHLTRMSFNLDGDEKDCKRHAFPGAIGEMPRLDERFSMKKYRYGYIKTPKGISRLDWDRMELSHYHVDGSSQEPIFIPRHQDAHEGDGWLLSVVNMHDSKKAELHVIDAMNLEAGAVAKVILPFALPFAFHGMFVEEKYLLK